MKKTVTSKTPPKKTLKQPATSVIDAIENVVNELRDSTMSEKYMKSVEAETKMLADFFHITELQAVLLCVIMELGPSNVDYGDISNFLGISKIRVWGYAPDLDNMVKCKLLKTSTNYQNQTCYELSQAAISCVQENKSYEQPKLTGLNAEEIFDMMSDWFEDLKTRDVTPKQLIDNLHELYDNNSEVEFVRQMHKLGLDDEDMLLLTYFCHRVVNDEENFVRFFNISYLYSSKSTFFRIKRDMRFGCSTLHKLKLIEHQCCDGVADTDGFRLTENAKTLLLSELDLNEPVEKVAGLLEHGELTEKQLYFSDDISRRLTDLEGLLQQEQYSKVLRRMNDKGFRNGFTVLLYGGPGTGKTETVYQLARKTGRDIMVVDIPNIRSMWVGESEKNIKAVFSRYRALVKKSKIAPILLFNEADAIIGQRRSGAVRSVDKMENAIQNIILQEMETLDGILIATTNLHQNLDKAFERRFLFKIKFESPSEEARASIWHTLIPELSDSDIRTLAARYDFSGGQIENIARLYNIDRILHDDCGLDMLIAHCDNERLEKKNNRPHIGF